MASKIVVLSGSKRLVFGRWKIAGSVYRLKCLGNFDIYLRLHLLVHWYTEPGVYMWTMALMIKRFNIVVFVSLDRFGAFYWDSLLLSTAQQSKVCLAQWTLPTAAFRFCTTLECKANTILDDVYKILKI